MGPGSAWSTVFGAGAAAGPFGYQTENISADFGTCAYAESEMADGAIMSLVLRVSAAGQRTTSASDLYMEVTGTDMDGRVVGPLRLWRFEQSELKRNEIYIIRGLRVVADTAWDRDQGKYAAKSDGSRAFECAWRTAVEHVTGVTSIARWFG